MDTQPYTRMTPLGGVTAKRDSGQATAFRSPLFAIATKTISLKQHNSSIQAP